MNQRKRLLNNVDGSSLPLGAIVVGALVASAAAAGDLGMWRLQDARLQDTVDAAALTLARTMAEGVIDGSRLNALAAAELESAGFLRSDGLAYSVEPNGTHEVKLSATYPAERLFGKAMGLAPATMGAEAIAGIGLDAVPLCAIVLNEEATGFGLRVHDDGALVGQGCRMFSNSHHPERGIEVSGESAISASALCVTGGYQIVENSTALPVPSTGCERAPDPLGHIPEPVWPTGGCLANPADHPGKNAMHNLGPGHYCDGLVLDRRTKARFSPGTYFINGDFAITTDEPHAFELDGVTLVVSGKIDIRPRRSFEITAPENGPLAGVAIWRTSTTPCPDPLFIGDNDDEEDPVIIGGAFYAPSCRLNISGEVSVETPEDSFTLLAVNRLEVADDARVTINAARTYGEPICKPDGAGAVKLRHSASTSGV